MRKSLAFYIILGIFTSLWVNFTNIGLIKKVNPNNQSINTQSMLNNTAIWSVDNEYYLTPPENFIDGKGWKRSPGAGDGSYFRRTPGYSIIYYLSLKTFGKENGILGLVVLQNILYLISIYCVYIIGNFLFKEHQLSRKLFSILYSVLPFFYSYNFFTLTESVSLFFSIFSLCFVIKAISADTKKRKYLFYILASLFISYCTLIRPFAGLLILMIPFFILVDQSIFGTKQKVKVLFVLMVFFVLPISIWTLRNYAVAKEVVILEKYMHPQSLDRTKPEFSAFWGITQCWGEDGGVFNGYFMPFYDTVLVGKTGDKQKQDILEKMNPKLWQVVSKQEFEATLNEYRSILISQIPYYQRNSAMPDVYSELEYKVTKQFGSYKEKYIAANKMEYYILTPLKYYKDLMLNSYSAHLFLFQSQSLSGGIFLKLIKALMLVIYILMHLSVIIYLIAFALKKYQRKSSTDQQNIVAFLSCLCLLFTSVLIFFFRAIEQRYFHPYLIFLLIGFVACFSLVIHISGSLFSKLKSR